MPRRAIYRFRRAARGERSAEAIDRFLQTASTVSATHFRPIKSVNVVRIECACLDWIVWRNFISEHVSLVFADLY
jgi:hypothetical protein